MLKVAQYEHIRREHIVNRKSINELSRTYHHSKRTIRKILDHITPPGYRRVKAPVRPTMGPYTEWIDQILESDRSAPKKQRHTAHRIFVRLVEEKGYTGCESGIRQYVRRWKQAHHQGEGFVRLSYEPGIDAQADYGEGWVIWNGVQEKVKVLSIRLCYSTRSFQVALPSETKESVFEGLRLGFEELGGVPHRVAFDNFPAAVSRILTSRDRKETDDFIGFRSYYLFDAEFCAPGKGNEKGHVETLVGYGRRNFMVPIPVITGYDDLNDHLRSACRADENRILHGRRVGDLFEEEKRQFRPLPQRPHPCRTIIRSRVNKFQEVHFDKHRYSVPLAYVGREILIHAGAFDLEIECDHQIVSHKRRVYRPGDSGIDPMDYLDILERKARAVDHAQVLKSWSLPEVFSRLRAALMHRYPGAPGDREYVRVLKLIRDFEMEVVEVAVGLALEYRSCSADAVKSICYQLVSSTASKGRVDLAHRADGIQDLRSWTPDLNQYDRLLKEASR